VCLSVGPVRDPYENGRTDRDSVWWSDLRGPKELGVGGRHLQLEGAICVVVRPIEKHWESLLWCMQQKDHSIVSNGMQQQG